MNLTVTEFTDADRSIFEEFLQRPEHAEHAMFYHTWEWGNLLKDTTLEVVRLGIYDGTKLIATAQVSLTKHKAGTYWYCPRGLMMDYRKSDQVTAAHKLLADYFKGKDGAAFFRVDPNIVLGDKAIEAIDILEPKHAAHFVQGEKVWMVDIQKTEEEQFQWLKEHNMRSNMASLYRKGLRAGVTVRASQDPKDLEILIELLNDLDTRKGGIHKRADSYFRLQHKHLVTAGYEKLFIAEREGNVLCITLISIYGLEASYLYGASSTIDRKLYGPQILHLKTMQYLAENHPEVKRYNFWGIVSEKNRVANNPHNGYSEFKRSFGGYVVDYIRPRDFVYNRLTWATIWAIDKRRRLKSRIY